MNQATHSRVASSTASAFVSIRYTERLAEAGIETIGGMLEFTKPGEGGYCKTLTDIKGIGTGKAEKIENALEEFWASHPDLVQEAVDAS